VGKERASHNNFAALLFGSDEEVWRPTLFDPIDEHRKPIHVRRAWATTAMQTAWHQEEPAIVGCLSVLHLNLAIIINGRLRRQRRISTAMPENQLSIPGLKGR